MAKMSLPAKAALAVVGCAAVAAGAAWSLGLGPWAGPRPVGTENPPSSPVPAPTAGNNTPGRLVIDRNPFEDGGVSLAIQFTGPIDDPLSLEDLGEAIRSRGRRGLETIRAELAKHKLTPESSPREAAYAVWNRQQLGLLLLYEGKLDEADAAFEEALGIAVSSKAEEKTRANLIALRGIAAMRRGEVDNCIMCLGPSSCIFPIASEAAHARQEGSREAIGHFNAYLKEWPGDPRVRWLLNLAHMTLDEYPAKVPPEFLVPLDAFKSKVDVGVFVNVSGKVGLTSRGPNQAGGSVFDDFSGDGLPDLFTTSLDADKGASLFVNKGDGTFEDRSESAGLGEQVYALNVIRADFDNDGDLDAFLTRGGWESPMRPSLLRNKGDGSFDDVTMAAGVAEPIASESAAWGDYDADGDLDLFVCGEYLPPSGDASAAKPDPRNRCRLYRNDGDGTFTDVAAKAGVTNEGCAKGSAWGDYDADGRLDLYVSNMAGDGKLYRNNGDGTFRDVAAGLKVPGPPRGFACWFWDYDNDGKLDLFVNDYSITLAESVAVMLGVPFGRTSRPRLYRNLGAEGFADVTREVGLDRPVLPMGCNFGDIDNDGWLDMYFGTGAMSFAHLVPNLMVKNVGGRRFEDITASSRTGHLQKGHGVSFADYDADGDLDLFVEAGGGVPGDKAYNLLFQNPGHGRHWLKVRLVGTKTNRSALGARIKAVVKGADGSTRTIYRTVGNNSSFGGNSLVESIGLGDATGVSELTVEWPTSKTTQTFRDVAADRKVEITEGSDEVR